MKKIVFGAMALLLCCSSCLKEAKEERTISYSTTNLIIPDNPSEECVASAATYLVKADVAAGRLAVSSNLKVGEQELTLVTDQVAYQAWNSLQGSLTKFTNAHGMASSLPVTAFNGSISGACFYPESNVSLPGVDFIPAGEFGPKVVFQYRLGNDYTVKTFSRDEVFSGTTTTRYHYNGEGLTFTTDKILYRLVINKDFKKADIIIYKAKFAEQQPMEIAAMLLKDLNVSFSSRGIQVSGTNVVPKVPEGNGYTEFANYTFDNILFQTISDDLTKATIDYSVAGKYHGQFSGLYVLTEVKEN